MKFQLFNKISAPWFLIASIVAALWIPHLFSLGMFMDGIEDALLAQSMYKGIGQFWAPQSFANSYSWGTPPLGLYLLSVCYKIFGDAYWVERFFSLGCALIQLILITWLWKLVYANNETAKKYLWLPGLLWIISPLVSWSYSNNLLDCTMAVFTTAAIMASLKYCITQKNIFLWTIVSALFLLLAILIKGPVAFFVLALPILFIGINDDYTLKRAIVFLALQLLFLVVLFVIVFSFEAPKDFLKHYLEVQLIPAFSYNGQNGERLIFLLDFVKVNVFPLIFFVFYLIFRKGVSANHSQSRQLAWRFLLLGLCGSLPILFSAKQKFFYLVPSLIPLTIGFAAYLFPFIEWLNKKISGQVQYILSLIVKAGSILTILLCFFLCYNYAGTIIRDEDILNDLKSLNALVKNGELVKADSSFYSEWSLQAYSLRLYNNRICVADEPVNTHYYITQPGKGSNILPAMAKKIFAGKTFDLFQN